MLLMIDNYDSFTYNLFQYIGELGQDVEVVRNDALSVPELAAMGLHGLIISPGPGAPNEAGVSLDAIRNFAGKVPILGVCLGHQAIGEVFGGRIVRAPEPVHGKTTLVYHDNRGVFADMPNPFRATRYHSLVIDRETCPSALEISAWTDDGIIMGIRHRTLNIEGVQFHPESIMTQDGKKLLGNFLRLLDQDTNKVAVVAGYSGEE